MPDVQVTYNPSQTPAWNFNPDPVRLNASGNIVFTQAPGSNWTFVTASVQSGGTQFGTPTVNGNGSQMTLHDAHTSNGHWCYTVTVMPTGATQSVTSPDPEIINDPPTPSPAPSAPK
jgi:hypothetical protein